MVKGKDIALVFEIKALNDELEELVPVKVILGEYQDNVFRDSKSNRTFRHIEKVRNGKYGYGMRNIYVSDDSSNVKEDLDAYLQQHQQFRYYRYKKKPNVIFTSVPGEEMAIYNDLDSLANHKNVGNMKPSDIETEIKKTVRGQDEAIKTIVTTLWMNMKFPEMPKNNMLVIGQNDSGKKTIFKELARILNVPLIIFPVNRLFLDGDVDTILERIYNVGEGDIDKLNRAIVILDGIDKFVFNDAVDADLAERSQSDLANVIEGVQKTVDLSELGISIDIDTTRTIFVGMGSFTAPHKYTDGVGFQSNLQTGTMDKLEDYYGKLRQFGMTKKLVGAFPVIVELNKLTKDVVKDILLNSGESELINVCNKLKKMCVNLLNIEQVADYISEYVIKQNLSIGEIPRVTNVIFSNIFYEIANSSIGYAELFIGPNIFDDYNDYKLTILRNKTKARVHSRKTKE